MTVLEQLERFGKALAHDVGGNAEAAYSLAVAVKQAEALAMVRLAYKRIREGADVRGELVPLRAVFLDGMPREILEQMIKKVA